MKIRPETTIDIEAPAGDFLVRFLRAPVSITTPPNNAKLGSSFLITSAASCKVHPGLGEEMTETITDVAVSLGNATPFQGTMPTGSGTTPWATWSFAASTTVLGPLTITARVHAELTGFSSNSSTDVRQVIIDITRPKITVNPPANVTKATPPYTATITGTAADDTTGVAAVMIMRKEETGRIEYPSAIYHVMSRGNEQKDIFKNQKYREKFLSYVASAVVRYGTVFICATFITHGPQRNDEEQTLCLQSL
jgi:hypothetical protein